MNRLGWFVVALTVAVYLLMVFWSLPFIAGQAGGQVPFDLRPGGYSGDEARAFLTALSAEGRAFYQGTQHWLDLVYPPLMAVSLGWAALSLMRRRWAIVVTLMAAGAAVSDWAENAAVAVLLRADPASVGDDAVARAAGWGMAKAGLTTLAATEVTAALAVTIYRRVRR
jgi:hypothetical protein